MKLMRLAVLLLLLAALATAPLAAGEAKVVRIAYNPMPLNLPSIVLRHGHYLEDALARKGWQLEWVTNLQTGPLMTEAMAAGVLDIAPVMGDVPTVIAVAAGREIRVFAPYSAAPKAFALVVPAASGIGDLKALAGKRIGLPVGTTSHYLLAKALTSVGLNLAQVEVVDLPVPDAATAVAGGKLDAAALVEPVLSKMVATGKVRILRNGEGLIGGLTLMTVRLKFAQANPDVIAAFSQAVNLALADLAKDPEAAYALAAQENGLPLDLVRKIAAEYRFAGLTQTEMKSELRRVAGFLYDQKLIQRQPTLRELLWK